MDVKNGDGITLSPDELDELHRKVARLQDLLKEAKALMCDSLRDRDWREWIADPPPIGELVMAVQADTDKGYAWALCERTEHGMVSFSGKPELGDAVNLLTYWRYLPAAPAELQGDLFA